MANKTYNQSFGGRNWQNIFIAAGIAIVAPYIIRRMLPLFERGAENVSARDVSIAGKDSVRDVADDMGVGGVSGTMSRAVDRVTDRLSH